VLPDSLLRAYRVTSRDDYFRMGKRCLDFLIKGSFINGVYAPVGQEGWHHQHGTRSHFDQQAVDVAAMILALEAYYAITSDESYRKLMRQTFNWFLGDNTTGQVVYDYITGGCYDGLGEKQVNLNEGAESCISYLIARLTVFK
jgi:uncharacterized protein YyaL (SSP411 family)